VNRIYGTNTIISQECQALVADHFLLRELDLVRVKGRAYPVTLYELLGSREEGTDPVWLEAFTAARKAYQVQNWDQAETSFNEVLRLKPDDLPSLTYLTRIKRYRKIPPHSDWKGIFNLESK
jgi:adenylate cyclase